MSGRKQGRVGGFTLIELLLVLMILAVLAAVVVPRFVGRAEQAKITRAKADIQMLESQLDIFEQDMGRYPTSEEGLRVLAEPPADSKNWHQLLKQGVPLDPWNNPYQYRYPPQQNKSGPDIWSFGPDGHEGGDDLDNWSGQ